MSQRNKKIDEYFKNQKRKAYIAVLCTVIPFVAILVWFAMPPMGKVSEIKGVVTNLTGVPTDMGDKLYMITTLENGDQVRVYIPRITSYQKGKEVDLIKMQPIFFGKTKYRLKSYVN